MAVTHPTSVRNAFVNHVVDQLDVGGAGWLRMFTSATVLVAALRLNTTGFGAAATGQAIANAITSDTNAVGGTIDRAKLRTVASGTIIQCSVTSTSGGGDIKLSSVIISAGQTVSISSLRYVGPA